MYSATKPLYVSGTRKALLVTFLILAFLSAAIIVVSYRQIQSSGFSVADLRAYFFLVGGPLLTAFTGYLLITATRLEFYADFVRIVGKRGAINRDIPYRDLDVGPLFEVSRQHYNHFRISARGVSKPSWEVINKRIASIDTFVYTLIEERKRGEPI